jgi:hypothetical protein
MNDSSSDFKPFDTGAIGVKEVHDLPEIKITDGKLHSIIEQIEAAILAADEQHLFQRGGMLVRLKRILQKEVGRKIERPAGSLIIAEATPECVRLEMARTARYVRFNAKEKKWVATDPPLKYARALAAKDEFPFKPLTGTIETPTLRPDGSLLQTLGYDEESGLYFDSNVRFPAINNNPSRTEAEDALQTLRDVLKDFPFVEGGEVVALAAILTALVRRSLPSAPMFLFDAPTRGSGKTLLSRVVARIAIGRNPVMMTYTGDHDEDRKRITSALLAGDLVVSFDNVSEPLGGDTLCTVLTEPEFSDRLLGTNNTVRLPTCVTFLATGHNIITLADISRRVLVSRIDPGMEHPEDRRFDYVLLDRVAEKRPELVVAALTMMRAYIAAGRPAVNIKPYGGFEAWSAIVRAPLVWLGCGDPCASRQQIEDEDPEYQALTTLLTALHERFEGIEFTVADALEKARQDAYDDNMLDRPPSALREALALVSPRREPNADSVGKAFRKYKDRVAAGLHLCKTRISHKVAVWEIRGASRGG